MKRNKFTLSAVALMFALGTGSTYAHHCTPVNKPTGAGAYGKLNIVTGEWTPSKRGAEGVEAGPGAFVTFTDGNFSYDLFMNQMLPDGALESGPDGASECDGRGVDDALDCLGIPH